MSGYYCCFLSCIQVPKEAGQVVWYSPLFKNIPQFVVIHTVKGGALQQKLIVFKIKINTLIFQKCIFLDFLESPRLGCQPQGGQEATIRNRHGAKDWSKMGKGVRKGCILSSRLFNLYAEYIMRNAGLDEPQPGIKTAGRNINNLRYADDTTLMAKSKDEKTAS